MERLLRLPGSVRVTGLRGEVVTDDGWRWISADDAPVPEGPVIVLLARLVEDEGLLARGDVAPCLAADDDPFELSPALRERPLVAIEFPAFSDGRGLSTAVILRTELGFTGELRAVGDVARDQLLAMARCGFDSFALREDQDPQRALAGLRPLSRAYQGDVLDPRPLFRRRRAQDDSTRAA